MIMGISLFVGAAVLFANLLDDMYAAADPQIRY